MACAEVTNAINWNKQSTIEVKFPVVAYFTKHSGLGTSTPFNPGFTPPFLTSKDNVLYGSGFVDAFDSPQPHLKGTLKISSNTELKDPSNTAKWGEVVARPELTCEVEIFPDGAFTYLMKINGQPIGGQPATKLPGTCLNDVLLTATHASEVITIGLARKQPYQTLVPVGITKVIERMSDGIFVWTGDPRCGNGGHYIHPGHGPGPGPGPGSAAFKLSVSKELLARLSPEQQKQFEALAKEYPAAAHSALGSVTKALDILNSVNNLLVNAKG